MFDNSLGEMFFLHHAELTPLYGRLPSEDLPLHMEHYRDAREEQIFGALLYMGMNGIKATSDFTEVNRYLAWRAAQDPIINIEDETLSVCQFLERYKLAFAAVGGTGGKTMAKWSDFDLLLIAPNEPKDLENDQNFRRGLSRIKSEYVDALRRSGITDFDIPLYSAAQMAEEVQFASQLDPFRKRNKDDLQRITSTLTAEFLFGDRESYDALQSAFRAAISEHADPILREFCHSVYVRHREYGYSHRRSVPDLKESAGFLRDINAITWLEKIHAIRHGEASALGLFSGEERLKLDAASSIQLQLKYSLHHDWRPGVDAITLKEVNTLYPTRVIPAFRSFKAIIPPHADQGRSAGRLLYEQADNVTRLLSATLQKVAGEEIFAGCHPRTSRMGRIFAAQKSSNEVSSEEAMLTCLGAVSELVKNSSHNSADRSLSVLSLDEQQVIGHITEMSHRIAPDESITKAVRDSFLALIADIRTAGTAMKFLHMTGLLVKLLPSFSEIENMNEIGSYLKTTIDSHSIDAVETLGLIASRELPGLEYLTEVLERIEDQPSLVLATLLHDVGRRKESEDRDRVGHDSSVIRPHTIIGAEFAERDLKDLHLSDKAPQTCRLITQHSLLPDLAYGINSADENELAKLANICGSIKNLDALFLLSFVDKYTSNREAFSHAKQRWLVGVYNSCRKIMGRSADTEIEIGKLIRAVGTHLTPSAEVYKQEIEQHFENLPVSYQSGCDARIIARHIKGVRDLNYQSRQGSTAVGNIVDFISSPGESPFLWDMVVVTADRDRLFVDIAASLYQRGLNIVSADIFTRSDGGRIACDVFSVCPNGYRSFVNGPKDRDLTAMMSNVLTHADSRQRLVDAISRELQDSARVLPPLPKILKQDMLGPAVSIKVSVSPHIDAIPSRDLQVECPDLPGLAYLIGHTLWEHGIAISRGKLGTGNRGVKNVFRIESATGGILDDIAVEAMKIDLIRRLVGENSIPQYH